MTNIYRKSSNAVFIGRLMLNMKNLKDELNQHRYSLERSIQRETVHLLKRIALLESCNASLSDRLAQAQKEIAVLKQQPVQVIQGKNTAPAGRSARLYAVNSQALQSAESNLQEKWGGHANAV